MMKKINRFLLGVFPTITFIIAIPTIITSCNSDSNEPIIPYDNYKYEIQGNNYRNYFFMSNSYSTEIQDKSDSEMFDYLETTREEIGRSWTNVKKFQEIINTHFFVNGFDEKQLFKSRDIKTNLISSSYFNTTLETTNPSNFFVIHIKNDS